MTQPNSPNSAPGSPHPNQVNAFHANDDADSSKVAHHHTLGPDANQASPGDHKHDGRDSKLLLQGKDTGFPSTASATYSQTEMQDVINMLRELGAGS